jgi:hypothetical protein
MREAELLEAICSTTLTGTAPITIDGGSAARDLTAARTIAISAATTAAAGSMSAADKKYLDRTHPTKVALTDQDATLDVATGTWYYMPASTLSANNRTLTLSPTVGSPVAGDQITITRVDTVAHSLAIVDGGAGTPTLMTMPNSKAAWCTCQFDGTNWFLKSFGVDATA